MTSQLTKAQRLTIATALLAQITADIAATTAAIAAAATGNEKLILGRQLEILQERKIQLQREKNEVS